MAEQYTNTQVTDIPEYMKKFQTTSDPNYTGILDEAMRQYRSLERVILPTNSLPIYRCRCVRLQDEHRSSNKGPR